jgi:hypothetical protein
MNIMMRTTNREFHACLYGYFRAVRFAGDLTDLGVEIQTQIYDNTRNRGLITSFDEAENFRRKGRF